jgi:DNA-binding HxlR family transcriptional regulator
LAESTVNGSGNGERSGAQILALLASPLNVRILQALGEGLKHQTQLRHEVGLPAQTTLRAQLKRLAAIGAIEKHRRNRFPGVLEYELTPPGVDLLGVAGVLERWLKQSPKGPIEIGINPGKIAIKALADGWSTTILRILAARPASLTELDRVIGEYSYPSLERRLNAMRLAGQIVPQPGNGRGTPYALTEWLRQGVAPILAAIRWERRHLAASTAPLGRLDVEALFLLAVPLLRLSSGLSGSCRMAVELPNGGERRLAGVLAEVQNGAIATLGTTLHGKSDSWALGSATDWLGAIVDNDASRLELGGDGTLAAVFVEGLHRALFEQSMSISP